MNPADSLELLLHGNQLKRTARTGWLQRGVPAAENVAAHSYGAAYTALVLHALIDDPPDLGRTLALVVLHDLPEALTTDIPRPAWRFLPPEAKAAAELAALEEILGEAPLASQWRAWWAELVGNETAAAQLAHDADKLDQFLQAYVYERQTGNQTLTEFWQRPHTFYFAQAQAIYDELCRRRAAPGLSV